MFSTGCLKIHKRHFFWRQGTYTAYQCVLRTVVEAWTLRDWPSPPPGSLHAWPFKSVMLSHVIRRPAGNHLLKALLWLRITEKKTTLAGVAEYWFWLVYRSACLTFTHAHIEKTDADMDTPPQRLLLSDMSHEQSPQLALRGFCMETWSSGAKNNIR